MCLTEAGMATNDPGTAGAGSGSGPANSVATGLQREDSFHEPGFGSPLNSVLDEAFTLFGDDCCRFPMDAR